MNGNGVSWISWYCSKKGNECYAEVSSDFILDGFNLTGLSTLAPLYKEALEMILDIESEEDEMSNKIPDISLLEPHAISLYGLIHQRFITTRQGLHRMLAKYQAGCFGLCPRFHCQGCKVLPCGQSDQPHRSTMRVYCPNCKDIYIPSDEHHSNIDGAHFGTTFPHLFVQTFPDAIQPLKTDVYEPKLFGFRLSPHGASVPKMAWLRMTNTDEK
ncbi:casein kinase 2 beta chain, CK2B [Gongronella butleri]|nr:casein kinase 2 beta chain, CK2B [Gongronella butleri]